MLPFSSLINILDNLTPPDIINHDDYLNILELTGELIHEYVSGNYLQMAEPTYHNEVYAEVIDELMNNIKDVYTDDIEVEIARIVEEALDIYFTHVSPRRSYKNAEIYGKINMNSMSLKLDYLTNVPQPDQRTTEWYHFRHKHLTASSLWKAFSSQSNINQLIYGKCAPLDVAKYGRVNLDSPLHWGQKYEDVSIGWYEKEYTTNVRDFGCIPHKELHYLAASPDGINIDINSQKYGRMLEVKNIVNRDITGIPKYEYWIQMQIQMEVCELSECDFLETRFIEYENYDSFISDGTFTHTSDNKVKGIMMLFIDSDGNPIYKYLDIGSDEERFHAWNIEKMAEMSGKASWLKTIYWKMDEVSVVLVKRARRWFHTAKPILDDLWKTIEYEREYGYEHRAPRKRPRISKEPPGIIGGICLIKLDDDGEPVNNTNEKQQDEKQQDEEQQDEEQQDDIEMIIESPKNDSNENKNVVIVDIDTQITSESPKNDSNENKNIVIMDIDTETLSDANQSFDTK